MSFPHPADDSILHDDDFGMPAEFGITLHELFRGLLQGGFGEAQALRLLAYLLAEHAASAQRDDS